MSGGEVFGRLVAVRRAGLGLSQEDLAARMDTSQPNIAGMEEGRPPSFDTLMRLATALNVEPGTAAVLNSLGGRRLWGPLAIAVLAPVLVSVGLRSSGTDGGDSFRHSPQAVSAAPAVPPVAAGGAQGKSRKTKRSEKKSATPAIAVSEPSIARAPTTKSPATIQPASEPVASSPAPSSSGGDSNDPPPQVQNNPPPQVQQGIGGGEAWHGIAPGGG